MNIKANKLRKITKNEFWILLNTTVKYTPD